MQCIVYCLNDAYMMDIKLTKCSLCSIVNDCVVQKRNNPRPVPPHRQESGGPSVYMQPLPARGDGRRPC